MLTTFLVSNRPTIKLSTRNVPLLGEDTQTSVGSEQSCRALKSMDLEGNQVLTQTLITKTL